MAKLRAGKGIIYCILIIMMGVLSMLLLLPVKAAEIDELMEPLGIRLLSGGKIAPEFTLKNLEGKEVSLSNFRGKIVFLNFWATWCPQCRSEIPSREKLYQRFKDEDFIMLAVNLRESEDTVKDFARDYKLNSPILLDSTGKTAATYGVRAIPITYLIDRQGNLIAQAVGARDWASPQTFELIEYLLEK